MADAKFPKFATLSLHAGQRPDPATGARAVPIYQTTSYVFQDSDRAAALFNLEEPGYIYSRIANPTVAVLEERLAALEGGVGAVCTASGQAALHLAIATLMGAGGHIVAAASLYGGSINLLKLTLPRFGIETSFVDPRDPAAFRAAIRPETRLVFAEILGNPGLEVLDIAAVADVAHQTQLPLMVDATFATPYLCRPIEHGCDIVMHSATKWLGGHGGIALAIMSPRLLQQLPPLPGWMGASDPFGFDATSVSLANDARRYTQSTMSYASMAGLVVAVEQLLSLGEARIEAHARSLSAMLVSDARKYGWEPFRGVGDPAGSPHIISLGRPHEDLQAIVEGLRRHNIVCGIRGGRIRISLAPYNDASDVNALIEALARAGSS